MYREAVFTLRVLNLGRNGQVVESGEIVMVGCRVLRHKKGKRSPSALK